MCFGEKCVKPGLIGQACTPYCAWGDCISGTCQKRQPLGAHCDEEGPLCERADGLTCAPDMTCQPFKMRPPARECARYLLGYPDVDSVACPWQLEKDMARPCELDGQQSADCVNGHRHEACVAE
jgi:hypothetical protein